MTSALHEWPHMALHRVPLGLISGLHANVQGGAEQGPTISPFAAAAGVHSPHSSQDDGAWREPFSGESSLSIKVLPSFF